MKSIYVVYSDNQMQRRHMEGEFMQNSGLFIVPFSHLKTLHDLIDKTCLEYFKKDESILIQKLKNLITQITSFSFSFPLWREILSQLKEKNLLASRHRNYFIQMNKIFMEENIDKQILNADETICDKIDEDDFGKDLGSYRSLQGIDNMNQQNVSFDTFQQMEKIMNFPQNEVKNQQSFFEIQKTNDQSIKKPIKKNIVQIKSSNNSLESSFCFLDPNSPIKQLQDFQKQTTKFSQSSIQFQIPKVSRKSKLPSYIKTSEEIDNFINSFKKHGSSPVAQMIIQDQSFNQITQNEKKTQKFRKKLDQELFQSTKSVKSKQYNRNIKTILMNKKVKDKKKQGYEGPKSKISGVIGAYQLRRATSQIFDFGEQTNSKSLKSSGKSVFNGKRQKKQ